MAMLLLVGRILLLVLPVLAWNAAPASALSFNGFWQHRVTGGDDIDTRHSFQQRYSLGAGVGAGFSFQPTHAISAGANLSYSRTERSIGQGITTSEEITPSAYLGISNDIFTTRLSGTVTESRRSSGADRTHQSFDTILASNWDRFLWPTLRLNYGEASTKSSRAEDGTRSSHHGFGLDWDLLLAEVFYAFNHTRTEGLSRETRSEADSHFARLETSGNFWQNRVNVRLSQQFQQFTSEFSIMVEEGEVFDLRLEGETRSAVIPAQQLTLVIPEDVEPAPDPRLNDTILDDPDPLNVGFNERAHLAIRFEDFDQQVGDLRVYLHPFLTQLTQPQAAMLQWDLYLRSPIDEETWTRTAEDIPAVYNVIDNRFELNIGRQVRELKVVVINQTGISLAVTELEAVTFLTDSAASRRTSHLTNAGLRFRLTPTLAASSSLTFEKADNEAGESESESTHRTLSSSLRWSPNPFVAPALGFSETRQEQTGAEDALSRSYSLIVATFPLETLNITLGATRSDRFRDQRRISTNDNYSLTSTARLYPDLTAGLSTGYSTSSMERDGTFSDIDTFSNRLTFNARLSRALTADLTGSYLQTKTAGAASFSSSDSILSMSYRPSDLLSMRLVGTRRWSGPDTPDTLIYSMNMALLRTNKIRVTFRYNHSRAEQIINILGLDGSWDISRSLALQSRFNYASAESDTWSVLTSVALRL